MGTRLSLQISRKRGIFYQAMIKIQTLLQLIFLVFTSLAATERNPQLDLFWQLEDGVKIKDDSLVTHQGIDYALYPYESQLHYDLNYVLKDETLTKQIHDAFSHHLGEIISLEPISHDLATITFYEETAFLPPFKKEAVNKEEAFSKALLSIAMLFGHPHISPAKALKKALLEQGRYGLELVKEHSVAFEAFVEEANRPLYRLEKRKEGPIRVVILTTSASGGNHSVANAMAHHLSSLDQVEPIVFDVEEVAVDNDPLMLATGVHTYDSAYSAIFQKSNNLKVLLKREGLYRKVQHYIPSNFLAALKQKIAELQPDFIISTRTYLPDDLSLATLGVPFRMFHTEFSLCPFLSGYYGKCDPDSIRFWIPTKEPSFFQPLFFWQQDLENFEPNDTEEVLLPKISSLLKVDQETFFKEFEVIGYPINPQFYPIMEPSPLHQKWQIEDGEIPIFIVMGKHGTGALNEIFDTLSISKSSLPLKYLFICGKNEELKKTLVAKRNDLPNSKAFSIYGLLTPEEMNEVMNISKLGISKAGGPAITEPLMTETPLLIMHIHPWEIPNANYVVDKGQGIRFDPAAPLITQIEFALCLTPQKDPYPLRGWEDRLTHAVEEIARHYHGPQNFMDDFASYWHCPTHLGEGSQP